MTLYIAFNCALDATTGQMAGTSYTAGSKCAIQLAPTSTDDIRLIELGISFNGFAAAASAVCTLAQASAASTMSFAHSTSTIVPFSDSSVASNLTMGTGASGFGNGAITTNTTERQYWGAFVSPTTQFAQQWPLARDCIVQPAKFAQLRINTSATVSAIAYIVFED